MPGIILLQMKNLNRNSFVFVNFFIEFDFLAEKNTDVALMDF